MKVKVQEAPKPIDKEVVSEEKQETKPFGEVMARLVKVPPMPKKNKKK